MKSSLWFAAGAMTFGAVQFFLMLLVALAALGHAPEVNVFGIVAKGLGMLAISACVSALFWAWGVKVFDARPSLLTSYLFGLACAMAVQIAVAALDSLAYMQLPAAARGLQGYMQFQWVRNGVLVVLTILAGFLAPKFSRRAG